MKTFSDIVQETRELIHSNPAARRLPRGRFLVDFLGELQEAHDREVRNPSLAYSFKATQDDALMLSNAREYDRGYQDGKRARSADEWRLSNDRREAASRLKKWQPDEDGRPQRELWEAVMGQYLPDVPAQCDAVLDTMLRDQLVYLLGDGVNGHVDGWRRGLMVTDQLRKWADAHLSWKDGSTGVVPAHDQHELHVELTEIARRIDNAYDTICRNYEYASRRYMEASEKARGLEQSLESVEAERDALLARVRSLEEDSIPATEENMERSGCVPKKVVDEANDRMEDLRDLVDALKSTIAWQNEEIARLKKEDE
jgi:hypothetical protein